MLLNPLISKGHYLDKWELPYNQINGLKQPDAVNTFPLLNQESLNVIGPHCSGTNLTTKLFKARGTQIEWKHTVDRAKLEPHFKYNNCNKFIFVYRDIHTWLKSFAISSYEVHWDGKMESKLEHHPQKIAKQFNVVELYIHLYNMYISLKELYSSQCVFVSYYNLLMPSGYDYYKRKTKELCIPAISLTQFNLILGKPAKGGNCVTTSKQALENRKTALDFDKLKFIDDFYSGVLSQLEKRISMYI